MKPNQIYLDAGLTLTDDGQYIGTKQQWDKYEELEAEAEEEISCHEIDYGENRRNAEENDGDYQEYKDAGIDGRLIV